MWEREQKEKIGVYGKLGFTAHLTQISIWIEYVYVPYTNLVYLLVLLSTFSVFTFLR